MQDVHSTGGGGGGGRLFSGGGAGDRRLRPHHHQNQQALKCPRCDSLNTKFCYYNNYNRSQPRHFCKGCRRYWTKGGVLRNVPVGGGCRKTKRSKPKQNTASTTCDTITASSTPPHELQEHQQLDHNSSNSHSSSESSSLTATNNKNASTAVEAVSALSVSSVVPNNLLNGIVESKIFPHENLNPSFEPTFLDQGSDCGIFSEIGSFTSLITSTNDVSFGFSNMMNQHQHQHQGLEHHFRHNQNQQQWPNHQQQEMTGGGLIDQTVHVELSAFPSSRSTKNNGGGEFGALDWQIGSGDQSAGLFDLPNAVDQAYWSQSHWNDQDHPTLYLP